MVNVELIPKNSVLDDIIDNWVNSGRVDNRSDGAFRFDKAEKFAVLDGGIIYIKYEDKAYHYNMSDFYRVKIEWV